MVEQETGLTLTGILQTLRRGWVVILATTLLGGAGAYAVSAAQTPIYEASSSVYFSLRQGLTSSDLNQGSAYTQAQMLSFATLATSSITLNKVVNDLGLDITAKDLSRNLSISIPQNTVILTITSSSPSAERAAKVANSVAKNLAVVVSEITPATKNEDAAVSARVIQPAVTPEFQSSPNKSRDTLLGVILGLLVGAIGCVVFALLDNRVRNADALASITAIPLLGQIGRMKKSDDPRPVMVRNPNGEEAEAFRRVRAGLRFAGVDRDVRAIMVTSGVPGEGKTTLAVDLALAAAESGARVILVDADLRRPRVAKWFGIEGSVGLTSVLVGTVELERARRAFGSTSLDFLLSGDTPPNPSELLASSRMAQVLETLSAEYDLVIVDTAPVLAVADSTLLSPHVDLTLFVIDASKMRKAQVLRSLRSLEIAGAHIGGIVLNRVKQRRRKSVYYYDSPIAPPTDSEIDGGVSIPQDYEFTAPDASTEPDVAPEQDASAPPPAGPDVDDTAPVDQEAVDEQAEPADDLGTDAATANEPASGERLALPATRPNPAFAPKPSGQRAPSQRKPRQSQNRSSRVRAGEATKERDGERE